MAPNTAADPQATSISIPSLSTSSSTGQLHVIIPADGQSFTAAVEKLHAKVYGTPDKGDLQSKLRDLSMSFSGENESGSGKPPKGQGLLTLAQKADLKPGDPEKRVSVPILCSPEFAHVVSGAAKIVPSQDWLVSIDLGIPPELLEQPDLQKAEQHIFQNQEEIKERAARTRAAIQEVMDDSNLRGHFGQTSGSIRDGQTGLIILNGTKEAMKKVKDLGGVSSVSPFALGKRASKPAPPSPQG